MPLRYGIGTSRFWLPRNAATEVLKSEQEGFGLENVRDLDEDFRSPKIELTCSVGEMMRANRLFHRAIGEDYAQNGLRCRRSCDANLQQPENSANSRNRFVRR